MADKWDTTPSHTGYRRIEQITEKSDSSSSKSSDDGVASTSSSKSYKSSKSKSNVKVNKTKTYKEVPLEVPKYRYKKPEEYSISRAGLELYETDEDSYVPFTPTSGGSGSTTVEDDSIDTDEEEEDAPGFSLHLGEIKQINYEPSINSLNFESDYKDMNDNAGIKVDDIDLKKSYKGVRVKLLTEWDNKDDKPFNWTDLKQATLGFITEQTFSEEGVDIKIGGMTKTLDIKYKFDFQQMYRSEIINQVIKTAGLKPMLNFKGLEDDITDFKNYSESGGSGSGSSVKIKSTGSKTLDEVVKRAVAGLTDPLAKAKAIDKAFKSHCYYSLYEDVHHPNLEEAWNHAHLNCADGANVLCAMFLAVGLNAVILHVTYHYIVKVTINGKSYLTDSSGATGSHNSKPFGQVFTYDGFTNGSVVGTRIPA